MIEKYQPTGTRIFRGNLKRYTLDKKGKRKQIYEYRDFIPTKTGEYEISDWKRKALAAVEQDGYMELFQRIRECVKEYKWLKNNEERDVWALECFYNKAYMHWEEFEIIWA